MRITLLAPCALLASAILLGCNQREAARTTADPQTDAGADAAAQAYEQAPADEGETAEPDVDAAAQAIQISDGATASPPMPGEPAESARPVFEDRPADAEFAANESAAPPPAAKSLKETFAATPGPPATEGRPGQRLPYSVRSESAPAGAPGGMGMGGLGGELSQTLTPSQRNNPNFNTEAYDHQPENDFIAVSDEALSTFSIDVDTASYANVRRFLDNNSLPPAGAVRVEELINYFDYNYEPPAENGHPFAVHVEMAKCPWNPEHELARIALKGREIDFQDRPSVNLVFLLDVSGSMRSDNKLSYVKESMRLLVNELDENDQVTIVVYAGAEGLALPTTTADHTEVILAAINRLQAGGSTNGGAGIRLAYEKAIENFIEEGVNRVILCTDGDFNVGVTNQSELVNLIEDKAKSGVFLSVLGYGMGNLKDSTMEKLADKGNGNYAYIDTLSEARKVLVEEITGTLITIAKDVKIQVDFNPARVAAYRLVGYENRMLAAQDFKDDTKDAGEIGAGHTVTALYELVPPGVPNPAGEVEPSIYQQPAEPTENADNNEAFTVRLRYKNPDADKSKLMKVAVDHHDQQFEKASADFRFAAAVAQFGMLLTESEYAPNATWPGTMKIATTSLGEDEHGYRAEFLNLVQQAATLNGEELPDRETARR